MPRRPPCRGGLPRPGYPQRYWPDGCRRLSKLLRCSVTERYSIGQSQDPLAGVLAPFAVYGAICQLVGRPEVQPVNAGVAAGRNTCPANADVSSGMETAKPERFVAYREGRLKGRLQDFGHSWRAVGQAIVPAAAFQAARKPSALAIAAFLWLRFLQVSRREAREIRQAPDKPAESRLQPGLNCPTKEPKPRKAP